MGWFVSIIFLIIFGFVGSRVSDVFAAGMLITSALFAIAGSIDLLSIRYMNIKKGE